MQFIQRLTLGGLVTVALFACSPDFSDYTKEIEELRIEVASLKYETKLLETKIEIELAEELAKNDYWDKKAGITLACDWLIKLCPESLAGSGRQALELGYGGVNKTFWALAFGKLLFLISGLGAMLSSLGWGWYRLIMPAKRNLESSQATIKEAANAAKVGRQEAAEARHQVTAAREELECVHEQAQNAQAGLSALEQRLAAKEAEIQEAEVSLKKIQAARFALG